MRIGRLLPAVAMVGMLVISMSPVATAANDGNGNRDTQQTDFNPDTAQLELETVFDGLDQPVEVTNAGDGTNRLFISERKGTIQVAVDGEIQEEPFLDISDVVRDEDGEQGFFGIAFHPDYAENGTFFAVYTKEPAGQNVLARFEVSDGNPNQANPESLTELISLEDQFANHNGGDLAFGPDGYLYYGTGDEGGAGDPNDRAQDMESYFGKMLRLDVDNGDPYAIPEDNPYIGDPDALDEIWAHGLRNPWRYSFDRETGDFYIGDVGQEMWEEVNFQPAGSSGGENYGWPIMEGTYCYPPVEGEHCTQDGLTMPILEYSHEGEPGERMGCSISGGYVYRGEASPFMDGVYVFGDWCEGRIWAGYLDDQNVWQMSELLDTHYGITSFGEDEQGELYLTNQGGNDPGAGTVMRLNFSQDQNQTEPPSAGEDHPAFQSTWERTDQPVANLDVSRTWIWGPQRNTEVMAEPYEEAPGGERSVVYYDKSRMEITNPDEGDPNSPWFVTNGLLVMELMTGQMQVGDNTFEERTPAELNAAGDQGDPDGITYQTLNGLRGDAPADDGAVISTVVNRDGNITDDPALADQGVTAGPLSEETGHRTASVFWDFMTSEGTILQDGELQTGPLFENPYFATGLPVTEAHWAQVEVGGTEQIVLIQAFERRVLTYTPGNDAGWQVEAGNVGQHYYEWRYGEPGPAPEPEPEPGEPRQIEVSMNNNSFSPSTIELTVGETVEFVATSVDTFHTFTVKESAEAEEDMFNLNVNVGETQTYTFTPEEPGELYLYCKPHEILGMVGTIIVNPAEE